MRGKTVVTREWMAAIHSNINRALEYSRNRPPIGSDDDVVKALSKVTFPVDVFLAPAKTKAWTLHSYENVYGWEIPPHMQILQPTAIAVCATMAFAFLNHLEVTMMVVSSKTFAGYSFQPGKKLGDVIIAETLLDAADMRRTNAREL